MLGTSIAGVYLENPLLNAAGCWDTTSVQLDQLMESRSSGIVTKSGTLQPRKGNPNPRLFIDDSDTSINSIGFANLGVEYYSQYKHKSQKPIIQSIHADELSDLPDLLNSIDFKSRLIELDIGCPNVPREKQGLNWESYEALLDAMSQISDRNLIWGVKLPPLFYPKDISTMARLIQKSNASFVTTINTIPNGLFVNVWQSTTRINPNDGRGGIGGALVKPIGLANVQQLYKELSIGRQIDIIGCGGISSATDVMEYIMCGAKAVQIGTHLLQYGPQMFEKMEKHLGNLVVQLSKGRSMQLADFVGTLQIKKAAL